MGHVRSLWEAPELASQEALTSGEGAIDPYDIWPRDRFEPLHDGEVIRTMGASLRVLHTPGHANDHVAMVLEEEGAMFTADNVLGVGTAVFSDLGLYIDSLERMRGAALALGSKYVKLYTGHGPHIENGVSVLGDYIEHRMARVRQVAMLLEDAGDGRDWSAEEVTRAIYDGVPEKLIMPATGVTQLVLRKLRDDGSSAIGIGLALRNLAKNWRSIGERYIGDHRKYRPVAPNRPAP